MDTRECSIVAQSIMKSVIEARHQPKDVDRVTRHHLTSLQRIVSDMVAGRPLVRQEGSKTPPEDDLPF